MITYQTHLENIEPKDLEGFFVGWPQAPSSAQLWQILTNSEFKVLAISEENPQIKVVGFITALSDKVLTVFISLLEVLPEFKKLGIGKKLMGEMLKLTEDFYMTDLVCDQSLVPFYTKFGLKEQIAMSRRNYNCQNGKNKGLEDF